MQKPRALLFFVAALVWLAVPVIAAAQGAIVPCDGISCDLCSIGQLMQNIVNFLIFFSLFIAVLMFAYAGFVYATSSGNPTRVSEAHKLFKDVLIGFLIAISAWLVVQTIISVVFDGDAFVGTNWYQLECSDPSKRLMNTNIGNLFDTVIPGVNAPAGGGTGGTSGSGGAIDTSGTVQNPTFRSNVSIKQGAQIVGLQQGTIDYINQVASTCGCSLVITEGTGGVHADGQFDHAAGYKLDVRSKDNPTLRAWVTQQGVAGSWSDGTPTYTMGNVVWALEDYGGVNEHWDIQVKPQ